MYIHDKRVRERSEYMQPVLGSLSRTRSLRGGESARVDARSRARVRVFV